jgi:hypothetical protein
MAAPSEDDGNSVPRLGVRGALTGPVCERTWIQLESELIVELFQHHTKKELSSNVTRVGNDLGRLYHPGLTKTVLLGE